ncbi:hypothetical protein C8R44DRAFT_758074 [Mycena epipterygia]|nr:hypothetical protein C8R44DRAFT_758074 [Mycena epipterygia]
MASSVPSLDGTLGNIEIGLVLATFLYGIQTLQTFNYYREYPKDVLALKILVASIWFLELGHTICGCHAMYSMTVTFYGRPQHIIDPPVSLIFTLFFHAIIALVVQTFFAFRVGILSRRWPTTIVCCILNLLRLICYLVIFANLYRRPDLALLLTEFHWLAITVLLIGPIVDVITATSLIYHLSRVRDSHLNRTTHTVDIIIIWTVETTIITSVSSIVDLILFLTRRDFSWTVFFLIQAKLFSNSMLASLNGRRRFRPLHPMHPNSDSHVIAFNSAPTIHPGLVVEMQRMGETANDVVRFPPKQVVATSNDFMDTSIKNHPPSV